MYALPLPHPASFQLRVLGVYNALLKCCTNTICDFSSQNKRNLNSGRTEELKRQRKGHICIGPRSLHRLQGHRAKQSPSFGQVNRVAPLSVS